MPIPRTKIVQKMSRRSLIQTIIDMNKQMMEFKQKQPEIIEKAVDEAIEKKTEYIEARLALKEANVLKHILYQKGILTEKEFMEEFEKRGK